MRRQLPFIAAISVAIAAVYVLVQLALPLNRQKPAEEIFIDEGMTFGQAASLLEEKGFIRDTSLFRLLGILTGADRRMRAGYYGVDGSMSPWQIFRMLREGRIIQSQVTVAEGESLLEIRERLVSRGLVNAVEFDRLVRDRDFMASLGVDAPSLEGFLFPDTYGIPKGTSTRKILETMVRRLMELYGGELRQRTNELGLSMTSAITLASIIEKEAVMDHERPLISAVFHNRLRRGMPLQADPTAVYGIKPPRAAVTKLDLQKKSRYNTYMIKGLPPGPIASPGLKSIRAALYPADVPYLYFVSNYDGTHRFSASYDEHRRAIENVKLKLQAEMLNSPAAPDGREIAGQYR